VLCWKNYMGVLTMNDNAMHGPSKDVLIILDDKRIISYRPRLNRETGSLTATVLLCQAMYWAMHSANPFYKFMQPCKHDQYHPGDSWVEELGMTRTEFETALKRIGQKLSSKSTGYDQDAFIWYWTDISRMTWFQINWKRVNEAVERAYSDVMQESCNRYCGIPEIHRSTKWKYEMQDSCNSNNEQRVTTESTQRVSSSSDAAPLPEKAQDEDDDLNRILLDLGLSREQAKDARDRHGDLLCHEKAKELIRSLDKIKNLGVYSRTTFGKAELYPPAQAEALRQRRVKKEERRKELDSSLRGNDEVHEIQMPEMSQDETRLFLESIKGNNLLMQRWQRNQTNSAIIRLAMAEWKRAK